MTGIIDTHQHFLPDIYVRTVGTDALALTMPNRTAPNWSGEAALSMMDRHGIAKGILSISAGPPLKGAAGLLRACNVAAAELDRAHPGRFGSFASLPLPDIDASLAEIAFAQDTLHCDGFVLFTNYDGEYLGAPAFRPILEELNRRSAVVFIHPTNPPAEFTGMPASIIEFPFETTRTAVSLILSGALKTFSNIRFVLSHAGGTLPYLAGRIAGAVSMNPPLREKIGDPKDAIRSFWFDLALSGNAAQIAALRQVAAPDRITFGSDFPMCPDPFIQASIPTIAEQFGDDEAANVFHNNAAMLLSKA